MAFFAISFRFLADIPAARTLPPSRPNTAPATFSLIGVAPFATALNASIGGYALTGFAASFTRAFEAWVRRPFETEGWENAAVEASGWSHSTMPTESWTSLSVLANTWAPSGSPSSSWTKE